MWHMWYTSLMSDIETDYVIGILDANGRLFASGRNGLKVMVRATPEVHAWLKSKFRGGFDRGRYVCAGRNHAYTLIAWWEANTAARSIELEAALAVWDTAPDSVARGKALARWERVRSTYDPIEED